MGTGEYRIAKQVGLKGYFGRVVLEAQPRNDGEVTIEFDRQRADEWQSGVRFGIEYAIEHVSPAKLLGSGAEVRVTVIEGQDCDTSTSLIAYVAARAMFQAIGVDPPNELPSLDLENGLVRFYK